MNAVPGLTLSMMPWAILPIRRSGTAITTASACPSARSRSTQSTPTVDFRAQDRDRPFDALLAAGAQPPEERSAEAAGRSAERPSLQDVGRASDAAVEDHLGAPADGGHDVGQNGNRGRNVIELTSAVI